MTTKKLTKLLALYLPYILLGLVATNFGEAWRLAEGKELGDKIMAMMGTIPVAFANPLPSLHPLDLLVGLCCGAGFPWCDRFVQLFRSFTHSFLFLGWCVSLFHL